MQHTPSRRDFLSTAGSLAAGSLALGALAGLAHAKPALRGADDKPIAKAKPRVPADPAKPLRIAIVGTGGPNGCAMGLGHALSIIALAEDKKVNAEIVAICDLNQLHLDYSKKAIDEQQSKRSIKPVDTHAKYKEVLSRDDIHGVVIATPEHWHAQMAIDAILAGKDVYLEKPMTLNLPDALALHRVHQANPEIICQVGTQQTNVPKWHEAKKLIEAGEIGVPTMSQTSYCRNSKSGEWHYKVNPDWKPGVNLDWDEWCGPLGPMAWDPKVYYQWRRYRKTSTGICGDLLAHVMSPMMMTLESQGWPVRVVATGSHLVDKEMENHDMINLQVEFETGHQMIVAGSTCNEVGLETLIRGHNANVYLNGRHCVVRPERTYSEEMDEKTIQCPDIGNDQDAHRVRWLQAIRSREGVWSTVELGLRVMVAIDLATRSMWEGGAFKFDPKTMTASRA